MLTAVTGFGLCRLPTITGRTRSMTRRRRMSFATTPKLSSLTQRSEFHSPNHTKLY